MVSPPRQCERGDCPRATVPLEVLRRQSEEAFAAARALALTGSSATSPPTDAVGSAGAEDTIHHLDCDSDTDVEEGRTSGFRVRAGEGGGSGEGACISAGVEGSSFGEVIDGVGHTTGGGGSGGASAGGSSGAPSVAGGRVAAPTRRSSRKSARREDPESDREEAVEGVGLRGVAPTFGDIDG